MVKYKRGALVKEVTEGAEKWYELAGWKKIGSTKKKNDKEPKKDNKNDKTDTEKATTA